MKPDWYKTVHFLLLQHRPDVSVADLEGTTPLHTAVSQQSFAICKRLLEAGANINARDNQGMTCLHCAVHQDNLNGVNFLLQHAPDVTMADHKGWTALHIAARSHVDCVRALLRYAPPTYLWTLDRPLGSKETQCATVPATKRRHTG